MMSPGHAGWTGEELWVGMGTVIYGAYFRFMIVNVPCRKVIRREFATKSVPYTISLFDFYLFILARGPRVQRMCFYY